MKLGLCLGSIILAEILAGEGFAQGKGPEVLAIDQKISMHADAITLARVLQLWDQATGMQSTVPPELADWKLTMHFAALSVDDALRKIFDGQPFGYILFEDQLVVRGRSPSESLAEPESALAPPYNDVPEVIDQRVLPEEARQKPQPPRQQPTFIPTPFGPIVSPAGSRPFIQLPPVPVAPPPPFFVPQFPTTPPAGAPNGPAQNDLFGPFPVYRDSNLPRVNPVNPE